MVEGKGRKKKKEQRKSFKETPCKEKDEKTLLSLNKITDTA